MFHPLDIFETDSDGSILWRGAAEDFKAARRLIEGLALSPSGEYLILNQHTGQRQHVRVVVGISTTATAAGALTTATA
jgi:hypothetical protein